MDRLANIHFNFAKVCWRLFLLNIYWLFFTIIGIGIFGFSPATNALYLILIDDEKKGISDNKGLFKQFFSYYKKNFFLSNQHLLPILFLQAFLFFELLVLREFSFTYYDDLIFGLLKLLIVLSVFFLLNTLWFARFEKNIYRIYQKSLILLFGKPLVTLTNFLLCVILFSVYYVYPGVFVVIGSSLFFYFQIKLFYIQQFRIHIV
jgi:uncharacterized membrane protein YesL